MIRCGPDQQAFVQQCLDQLGSAGVALDAFITHFGDALVPWNGKA